MEHGINHAVTIIIFSFLIFVTVGLTSYGIEFAHAIEYKAQVNNQVERQGGLTKQAQKSLVLIAKVTTIIRLVSIVVRQQSKPMERQWNMKSIVKYNSCFSKCLSKC